MFYKDSQQIFRATGLDALPWLIHGFGTRASDIPALFANLATVKQIHSAECLAAGGRAGELGRADALLENTPGAVVAVKTADCVPVLLVDDRLRAVAAVHAGWRGTAAGIVRRVVGAMRERYGTVPGDLHAAVGPAIGKCCYEVGPEVAAQFGKDGRVHLDLAAENQRQLVDAGVAPGRIDLSGLCTMCHPEDWHSFRRDRETAGRQYSFVGIR